jgi:hypothetical protein
VRNVDIDLAEEDWRPRTPGLPDTGRLRMQVVSAQATEPPIDPAYVWVEGFRYLDDDPGSWPARELARYTALPPELRARLEPSQDRRP